MRFKVDYLQGIKESGNQGKWETGTGTWELEATGSIKV